ncbi:hypothetical protein [Eubacterium callanderi]|nr:hypothetical protein [Eubacterium callanderi]MBO1701345.1 hypothetical protein [Eubacterium callanderi]
MKKIKRTLFIMTILCFFPMVVSAAQGSTDVYIDIASIPGQSMHFLVVEETGEPICGATIDVWANSVLGYQLLGVTQSDGRYETKFPAGHTYAYRVHKTGYETVEQTLATPKDEEKVVLRKKSSNDSGTQSADKNVYTGILTSHADVILLLVIFLLLCFIMLFRKKE